MIYLTGDLHGDINDKRLNFFKSLDKDSTLAVLGDFGFFWQKKYIDFWDSLNLKCQTFVVLGNHEGYHILSTFPKDEVYGAKCRKMNNNTFIINHGEIFTLNDKKFFVFGGALSIDKAWRTLYINWWPDEQPNQSDYMNAVNNLEKVDWNIDYFLAHDVNKDIAKKIFGVKTLIDSSTSTMLGEIESQIKINNGKPYEYFFGHWHQFGKYGEDIKYTCLYKEVYCLDTGEVKFFS